MIPVAVILSILWGSVMLFGPNIVAWYRQRSKQEAVKPRSIFIFTNAGIYTNQKLTDYELDVVLRAATARAQLLAQYSEPQDRN